MFYGTIMQSQNEFFSDKVVTTLKDHDKFITAGTIDRTVLEDIADHPAGRKDIFITGFMAERIIDYFKTVDVTYHDCKLIYCLFFNRGIDLFLLQQESVLALDTGQRVGKCDDPCLITFVISLPLPLLHRVIIAEHDKQ